MEPKMFEVDYGSGSVLGMEGMDNVSLAGLSLSQVLLGLVLYEDQQVRSAPDGGRGRNVTQSCTRGYLQLLFTLPAERGLCVSGIAFFLLLNVSVPRPASCKRLPSLATVVDTRTSLNAGVHIFVSPFVNARLTTDLHVERLKLLS